MNRSLELNVSMYADDAMIKTKIKGKEKFVTKEEFMAKLPDDLKEWENKKQNLCGRSTIDFKRSRIVGRIGFACRAALQIIKRQMSRIIDISGADACHH